MPYSYKELTGDTILPELKDTVNDIGKYLENDNISNVKTISGVDFNNVTDYVDSTGNYYSTNSINTPVNARPHGFFNIYIRDGNYYKLLYSPYNSSTLYIRTYNFGTLSDWEQVKLDQSQYSVNNSIDPTGLNGTQTLYGTLTKPPKSNLSEGWVVYLEGTNKSQSLLTFYPKNSSSVFTLNKNTSTWNEYNSKKQLSSSLPVDNEHDSYFKYRFWKDDVGSKSMFDLLYELPQGFHTVYLQAGIKDLPSSQSVRGIVNVDNSKGDTTSSSKFIRVTLFDDDSKQYNFYYNNSSWGVPMTTESRYTLWTGELDLASIDTSISLNDSLNNYDMLEITYTTSSTGGHRTIRYNLRTTNEPFFYIKDINLINDNVGSTIIFFEGFLKIVSSKAITPGMSKRVTLSGSTNSTKVDSFNQLGEIIVYQISGIKNM
mgnify:CR=1 FL=1